MTLATTERKKYEQVWQLPQYANHSPGEWAAPLFCQMTRQRGSLLDIGCGSGKGGAALAEKGFDVEYMDFVKATNQTPFIKQNLWTKWKTPYLWEYGYCCDVMEHIPPEKVDAVLGNIWEHAEKTFFLINFAEDHFGKVIGQPLHLTIQPFTWWRDKLGEHFTVTQARDLLGMGAFYVR